MKPDDERYEYVQVSIWTRHGRDGEGDYEIYRLPDRTEYRGNLYARVPKEVDA